jgi:hypothetical protein
VEGEGYGPLRADVDEFNPDHLDWAAKARAVVVAEGEEAENAEPCLRESVEKVNAARIPYKVLGPNSNSYAFSALEECVAGARRPPGPAQGWGMNILEKKEGEGQ